MHIWHTSHAARAAPPACCACCTYIHTPAWQVKLLVEANRHLDGLHARARLYKGTTLFLPGHDRSADPNDTPDQAADADPALVVKADESVGSAICSPPAAAALAPAAGADCPLRARDESLARKRRRPGWYVHDVGGAATPSDVADGSDGRSRRLSRLEACLGRIRTHRMQRSACAALESVQAELQTDADTGACSDSDGSLLSVSSDDEPSSGSPRPAPLAVSGLPPWLQACTWAVDPRSSSADIAASDGDGRTLLVLRATGAQLAPLSRDAGCQQDSAASFLADAVSPTADDGSTEAPGGQRSPA